MTASTMKVATVTKPLDRVRQQWTTLGEKDPFWAVLTNPAMKGGRWDPTAFYETGVVEVDAVIRAAQQASPIRFGTALDFGCGVGRLSQALAQRFERVIGIDIAASMIQVANQFNRFPGRCQYLHNNAAHLAVVEGASVDFVYSNITLQHMVPSLARGYIREFFRVARPGGHVIFQLPSRPSSRIEQWVKRAIPIALTNRSWRIRSGSPAAMESYFIPEPKIRSLVERSGGSLLLVDATPEGPEGWQSRKYFCVRT